MKQYEAKTFNLPEIPGISTKTMEVHLGLYDGYVKNLNMHYEALGALKESGDTSDPLIETALARRVSFELAGVINHDVYFGALENGPSEISQNSSLHDAIKKQYGSFDALIGHTQNIAKNMRGIGWVVVAYDKGREALHTLWVCDHEMGNVNLPALLAIDMWEHAYVMDYLPAKKGEYVDAYLNAVNWKKVEDIFEQL